MVYGEPFYIYDRLITKINYDSIIAKVGVIVIFATICDNVLLKSLNINNIGHKLIFGFVLICKTCRQVSSHLFIGE